MNTKEILAEIRVKAHALATEMTCVNTQRKQLKLAAQIAKEQYDNNIAINQMLASRGINQKGNNNTSKMLRNEYRHYTV